MCDPTLEQGIWRSIEAVYIGVMSNSSGIKLVRGLSAVKVVLRISM